MYDERVYYALKGNKVQIMSDVYFVPSSMPIMSREAIEESIASIKRSRHLYTEEAYDRHLSVLNGALVFRQKETPIWKKWWYIFRRIW